MKPSWLNNVFPIAAIFSFRMLGLFMLIPVFTLYATALDNATPTLIGLALGGYGLSQGLLQIPFGMLSDRYGRKPIITMGLLLFAFGSLFGALTHSIYGMIFARILQGAGAIGGVLIALLADLTPDEQRTKAMAIIGVTIGFSFSLAMVISPAITAYFGLSGIFYCTAILAIFGLMLLHYSIATPTKEPFHLDSEANPTLFKEVITNKHLQRLNLSIFSQHFILTSTFFAFPIILQQQLKQGHVTQQWHFYLPLILLSFFAMIPLLLIAERKQQAKFVFLGAIITTIFTQLLLALTYQNWFSICCLMFAYFVAFNILEATIPSLISRQANGKSKGTAMGVYSSCQFLGIFVGGALAGFIYQFLGIDALFLTNALFALGWFSIAIHIQPNDYQATLIISTSTLAINQEKLVNELRSLPGVTDVAIASAEEAIYLRINRAYYKEGSAHLLLKQYTMT